MSQRLLLPSIPQRVSPCSSESLKSHEFDLASDKKLRSEKMPTISSRDPKVLFLLFD